MERKRGARGQERASGTLRGKNESTYLMLVSNGVCDQRIHTHTRPRNTTHAHTDSLPCEGMLAGVNIRSRRHTWKREER